MSAEWDGAQRWQATLDRLQGLADFSDVFDAVLDEEVLPEIRTQFDTEGRGRWPKLSPAYERRKRRLYGDRPILQATGEMYLSLTVPGAANQIREVGPDEVLFGTTLERARFHQRRRKIFSLTREFRRKARERARKVFAEKLKRLARG